MNMYYLALVLPPHLNEQVLTWKEEFHEKYGCKVGLKSPAHITLVPPFKMPPHKEEALLQQVNQFAQQQESFELTTNGFSAFKPRTIFVAVQPSDALHKLKKNMEQLLADSKEYGIKKENRPFHPHITLATRDLEKNDFFDAWPNFQNQSFVASWPVNGISVLRHNGRSWDVLHTATFPVGNEEQQLF